MATEEVIQGCITGHLYNALDHQGGATPKDVLALFEGAGTITIIPPASTLIEALVALDQAMPFMYADGSVPGGNTVGNSTTLTAFASQYSIPADTLRVGSVVRVQARGVVGATASPTLGLALRVGGTAVLSTVAVSIGTVTAQSWCLEAVLVITALGAPGACEAQGEARLPSSTADGRFASMPSAAAVPINTTIARVLDITAQWGTADAANVVTLRSFVVEILNQP